MNGSQFARSENNRRSTQIAYDNREPDSEPSEESPHSDLMGWLKSDMIAMNAANVLAYRDMPPPNRPITDDDRLPQSDDMAEFCEPRPVSQEDGS